MGPPKNKTDRSEGPFKVSLLRDVDVRALSMILDQRVRLRFWRPGNSGLTSLSLIGGVW